MKRLNACVKNVLAAALFRSRRRFDVDLKGRRDLMPLWSSTSAAARDHSRDPQPPARSRSLWSRTDAPR